MQRIHKKRKHKKLWVAAVALLVLLAILSSVFFIYTGFYYPAAPEARSVAAGYSTAIYETNGYFACVPPGRASTGFIFYPGGKVDAEAYLPYLAQVAQQGYLCVLLKMPFRLAILGTGAAADAMADYPQITSWAVGGHSLGGVAASQYANGAGANVAGLVLLAAYPTQDFSHSNLAVLSITASNDTVLNWDNYNQARAKLPSQTVYVAISGGNHSQFGMYGHQSGDGRATISGESQRAQVAEATAKWLQSIAESAG